MKEVKERKEQMRRPGDNESQIPLLTECVMTYSTSNL